MYKKVSINSNITKINLIYLFKIQNMKKNIIYLIYFIPFFIFTHFSLNLFKNKLTMLKNFTLYEDIIKIKLKYFHVI